MIGIICAMDIELEKIKEKMVKMREESISTITYLIGKIEDKDCVAAVSGIGKVNSAVCAQTMILKYKPKFIINTGVAGGLLKEMNIGDIAISCSAVQHDVDTSILGDPKGFISTINMIRLPCSKRLINVLLENNKQDKIFSGIIASGDQFIASKEKLMYIKNEFDAVACDMESASIAQVCYLNSVEFLSIRSISDNIYKHNSNLDYEKFKLQSANTASRIVCSLISSL